MASHPASWVGPSPASAPVRRRRSSRRLVRELSILVVVKLAILFGLYLAFFSPAHHATADAAGVANRLLAPSPPSSQQRP